MKVSINYLSSMLVRSGISTKTGADKRVGLPDIVECTLIDLLAIAKTY